MEPIKTIENEEGYEVEIFEGGRAVIKKPIPERIVPASIEETEIFLMTLSQEKDSLLDEISRAENSIEAHQERIKEINSKLKYFEK